LTIITITDLTTGEVVKTFDVTERSIAAQERFFDWVVRRTDLNMYDVVMTTPEDGKARGGAKK
jgi:hypothetical protein